MLQLSPLLLLASIGAAVLAVLLLAWLLLRRRSKGRLAVSETPEPQQPAEDRPILLANLEVTLVPTRFDLTLINASLLCRLRLENRGETTMVALRVYTDWVGAHASVTQDEQLRGPAIEGANLHRVDQLNPQQSTEIAMHLQLANSEIKPMVQGNAKMTLPLVRIRIIGAGTPPIGRAFVVGLPSAQGELLQPIRLNSGPSAHTNLAARALN